MENPFTTDIAKTKMLIYYVTCKSVTLWFVMQSINATGMNQNDDEYYMFYHTSTINQVECPLPPVAPSTEDVIIASGQFQVCDFGIKDEDRV